MYQRNHNTKLHNIDYYKKNIQNQEQTDVL